MLALNLGQRLLSGIQPEMPFESMMARFRSLTDFSARTTSKALSLRDWKACLSNADTGSTTSNSNTVTSELEPVPTQVPSYSLVPSNVSPLARTTSPSLALVNVHWKSFGESVRDWTGLHSLPDHVAQVGGCGCDAAAGCGCGAAASGAAAAGFVLLLTKNFSFLVTAGAALRLSLHLHPSDRASIASIVLRSDTGRPGFAPFPLGRFGSPAGTSEPPEPLLRLGFGLLNVSASAPDMPG